MRTQFKIRKQLRQGEIDIFYPSHYHKMMSFNNAITLSKTIVYMNEIISHAWRIGR